MWRRCDGLRRLRHKLRRLVSTRRVGIGRAVGVCVVAGLLRLLLRRGVAVVVRRRRPARRRIWIVVGWLAGWLLRRLRLVLLLYVECRCTGIVERRDAVRNRCRGLVERSRFGGSSLLLGGRGSWKVGRDCQLYDTQRIGTS